MKVRMTITLTPESKAEAIQEFAKKYKEFKIYVEKLIKSGTLPQGTETQWLLKSGRYE